MSPDSHAIADADATARRKRRVATLASLVAVAFWGIDAGLLLRTTDTAFVRAVLPLGEMFAERLVLTIAVVVVALVIVHVLEDGRQRRAAGPEPVDPVTPKYDAVLSASFDGVLLVDQERCVVEANGMAAALFGGGPDRLRGMRLGELLEPEPASPDVAVAWRDLCADGARHSTRASGTALSGRRFPADVRIIAVRGAGQPRHAVVVRRTTDSVIAEKALKRSETRYRALFDNILDGVYRSLPTGELLAANPALVRMLGYESREELLATGNTNRLYKDPDQRTRIVALLEEYGAARNVEIKLRRRDGSTLTVLANIRSVRDDSGVGIVYEGTLSDISDLLEARAALEDSEEHFRAVTENARDVINVIDDMGRILYVSPSVSTVTGRPPAASIGTDFFDAFHADDVDDLRRRVEDVFIRPGQSQQFTCRVRAASDRSVRLFEVVGTAYLTRDGELRAVFHSRDLTERAGTAAGIARMQTRRVVPLTNSMASN